MLAELDTSSIQVLLLVVQGKSNQQIADDMVITLSTAQAQVSNILDKLQVSSRSEAIAYAIKNKIVTL